MSDMIIICGSETVAAGHRDAVVKRFADMVSRARQVEGCVHFAVDADAIDSERINVVEVWRDETTLDSWRAQANPPKLGDVFDSMDVKRYDARGGGPLF